MADQSAPAQGARDSLLAHLTARFRHPAEVLATESLCYLTVRHSQFRAALVDLLLPEAVPARTRDGIRFAVEVTSAEDGGRTDVEGSFRGRRLIVVEGKFGAPLRDTQPVAYAARLEEGGALLFVCPPQQIARLIGTLHPRALGAGIAEAAVGTGWVRDGAGVQWLALTGGRRLGIVSWGALLAALRRRAGPLPVSAVSDLHQLEGLVAKFESDLLEWTPESLERGQGAGLFILALQSADAMIDAVKVFPGVTWSTESDANARWKRIHRSGARPETFQDWYGMMVTITGVPVALAFEPTTWGAPGFPTPLQIELDVRALGDDVARPLYSTYRRMVEAANDRFQDFLGTRPATPTPDDQNWWRVPFPLPPGLAGEEARQSIEATARAVLAPLLPHLERVVALPSQHDPAGHAGH